MPLTKVEKLKHRILTAKLECDSLPYQQVKALCTRYPKLDKKRVADVLMCRYGDKNITVKFEAYCDKLNNHE